MPEWIHPGLVLILGAWLIPFVGGPLKKLVMLAVPAAAFVLCLLASEGTYGQASFLGQEIVFGRVDGLSSIFSIVFSLMALIGMIFALHVEDDAQHTSALVYAGGALGVTFAGDFLSLYVFWELMAVSSAALVFLKREKEAIAAGARYLLVHVVGGLVLLAGILLYWNETGSLAFEDLGELSGSWAWGLILVAFLINAAVPPFGAWLPDAYPQASVTGSVFMTAFTTKSAVYVLIRGFPGTELLIWLGAAMALYGVVYAVLENDARRLLAYHIISQVGYMVCGVGIGTKLALNGATAHAFAHILYKALLFMGTGAVVQMSGRKLLTEMGGLYRTMPKTLGLYMIGACAISAFPLFSGFVSKSMVVSAAGEDHRMAIFLMLTLASAGTFLHTGLKLPWYMFFGKDCGVRPAEPPRNMLAAMGIAAFLCVAIGVLPGVLYARLPFDAPYHPYTLAHVTASAGMLGFTALGFFLLLSHLDPEPKISLDTDWFYRKGTALLMRVVRGPLVWIEGVVGGLYEHLLAKPVLGVAKFMRGLDSGLVDAVMLGIGRTALAIGRGLRTTSSGHSQDQALLMAAGVLVLVFLALGVL
ncbi:MAG: Na(+)/H(+) antiporter subunit D [Planctomycetota bacterium]|jgi:multicomponent Na+:H+ antiporter subunit D|nr:Na(+)/H(+) antiporter subunit D [Planctomycetota bacterium]MDP6988071.1 Na(+)/H(+) antiporter subunit D [Planctomycetota bacterium]